MELAGSAENCHQNFPPRVIGSSAYVISGTNDRKPSASLQPPPSSLLRRNPTLSHHGHRNIMVNSFVGALALASIPSALAFRNSSPYFLFSTAEYVQLPQASGVGFHVAAGLT